MRLYGRLGEVSDFCKRCVGYLLITGWLWTVKLSCYGKWSLGNLLYTKSCNGYCIMQKQPPVVFCEKRGSSKFHKIHRKAPVPESLFNKVAGLRPTTLLKTGLWHRCFPVNFVIFRRTTFSQNLQTTASYNGLIDSYFDMECNNDGAVRKKTGISCRRILTRTYQPFVYHVFSILKGIYASRDSLACTTIQISGSCPNFVSYLNFFITEAVII